MAHPLCRQPQSLCKGQAGLQQPGLVCDGPALSLARTQESQSQAIGSEITHQPSACMPRWLSSPEKGLSRLLRRSGLSDSPSSEVPVDNGDVASSSSTVSRLSAGGALRCRAICRAVRRLEVNNQGGTQAAIKLDKAAFLQGRCPDNCTDGAQALYRSPDRQDRLGIRQALACQAIC